MLDRLSQYTLGAAVNAAGGVLMFSYGHPAIAAVNAALTVGAIGGSFRAAAGLILNRVSESRDEVEGMIEDEFDMLCDKLALPKSPKVEKLKHLKEFIR